MDGFNLYYRAVRGTRLKWLDLIRLTTLLLPCELEIERLRYFTARVSGRVDQWAPARQRVYLNALATLPEVRIHYGRFLAKTVWQPLCNLPVADRVIDAPKPVTLPEGDHPVLGGRRSQTLPVGVYPHERRIRRHRRNAFKRPIPGTVVAEFHAMEEKGSDVNLAAYLLNDAWKGLFDVAVVITNDTDLVVPIEIVTKELNRPVYVVCPSPRHMAHQLRNVATYVRHIDRPTLKAAQFPDTLPGTRISKPASW